MKDFFGEYGKLITTGVLVISMLVFSNPLTNAITKSIGGGTEQLGNKAYAGMSKWEVPPYYTGSVLQIDGSKYIVLGQTAEGYLRLMNYGNIGGMQFQPNQDSYNMFQSPFKRSDGNYYNTYENSYIDNYLENDYYNSLPDKIKNAIVETKIKQASYSFSGKMNPKWHYTDNWYYNEGTNDNPNWVRWDKANIPEGESGTRPFSEYTKSDTGCEEVKYNEINRHVFCPSVEEINNLVDLNSAIDTCNFTKIVGNVWTRDSSKNNYISAIDIIQRDMSQCFSHVDDNCYCVSPAFVIDISKLDNVKIVDTLAFK